MTDKDGKTTTEIASGLAFNGLISLRNMEGQLRWSGAQLGIILNMTGWATVALRMISWFTTTRNPKLPYEFYIEKWAILIGCLAFASANFILHEIQKRDTRLMEYWNKCIGDLEKANGIQGGVKVFTTPEYERLQRSRSRISNRLRILSFLSIIIWLIFAIVCTMAIAVQYVLIGAST